MSKFNYRKEDSPIAVKISDYTDPTPSERYRRKPGVCSFCDEHRDDSMMPSHTPSDRCESGKHPHCTCETCF